MAMADAYHVVTEEWAPYNYLENKQITGMTTDIVRAIMARTGDHFDIELVPSMRASYVLKGHARTIMFSMFRTPERETQFKWVGPIVEEAIYPYQLATAQPPVTTLQQLLQAPQITTRQAGLLPDTLEAKGFTNLDRSANGNLQLYRMLMARRTGIIVGDTPTGVAYYSRQLNIAPGTLRQIPIELYRSSLYIAFSSDSDDKLVAAWASALEQIKQSGELARIEKKYEALGQP
jgi:polar amino acid transport system substrate-binding protein